ncbi:hypothetical protein FO519_003546 [Halicephalobus sp. NKZ332]|nr:hypothetical protein FO519_003546 [Halicephalobus sp. NKZ332]
MSATCRLAGELYPAQLFRSIACARCLFFIYFVTSPYTGRYQFDICDTGVLICDPHENPCSCSETPNRTFNIPGFSINSSLSISLDSLHLEPDLPPDFVIITEQCCEAAVKCCDNVLSPDAEVNPETSYIVSREAPKRGPKSLPTNRDGAISCPATWDGWQCFERSLPGAVHKRCPNYIFGDRLRNDVDSGDIVAKECLTNGEWFKKKWGNTVSEWTDYSGCVLNQQSMLKLVAGIVAFSVTVIAIIPAIIIISSHSALKKQTVFRIHKNLLYSFLFSGLFYLFNCFFFVIDGAIGDHLYFINHISCRILFTLQLRYFRLSTFTWMLGEGVYLYRLLMCTFSSEAESLKPYYVLCWGFPLVVTIAYSALRQIFDNEECWVSPSKVFWIEWTIMGPCLIALCINLLLVLMILYVLIKKLRYNPHLEPAQYTKAVRAVFMLVPVFGLHFLITIYRIQSTLHQIINLTLDGIQGFVVALIVCYTNKTVIECVKKWIEKYLEERKLRRQSEDQRIQFKRSIETSFAIEKLYPRTVNMDPNSNGITLMHNFSKDSDENEESIDINGIPTAQSGLSAITDMNGVTTIIPSKNTTNFV